MRINHKCYVGGSSRLDIMEFEELQFRLHEVGVSVPDGTLRRWATIITFKLRGTPVRAQDMNRIRLSGSVRMETRPCIKRTGTRAVALLTEPDRGTTMQ
jgi:hypothetical protein